MKKKHNLSLQNSRILSDKNTFRKPMSSKLGLINILETPNVVNQYKSKISKITKHKAIDFYKVSTRLNFCCVEVNTFLFNLIALNIFNSNIVV